MNTEYIKLAEKIDNFLEKYGIKINNDWNGPDSAILAKASILLKNNIKPEYVFSFWSQGCFHPQECKEGEKEHFEIISKLKSLK